VARRGDRRAQPSPLRIPAFRYQFFAQATSVVGSTLSPVALSLGVLQLTGSAHQFSLVLAASSVPIVLFVLIGGVWADRLPRHKVMVTADLICAATQTSIGLMLVTGSFHLWLAVVAQFLTGTALAFYYPSINGLTAHNVPAERLQRANAMLSLTRSVAGSVGPLVAAVLVIAGDAGEALLFDAFTFIVSAFLLSRLSVPSARDGLATGTRFVTDLVSGFREVTSRSWVWSSILSFMVGHLATALLLVLGPLLLSQRGRSQIEWGALIAALSVGQILGDLIALRIRPGRPLVLSRLAESLAASVPFALALNTPGWVVVAAAVPAGVALTLPDALWFTALQQHLPAEALSRVSSYDWLGSLSLRPIGYLCAGALATTIRPAPTLAAAAGLLIIVKLTGLLFADVRALTATADSGADTVTATHSEG
jgi:MFS family permease